MKTRRSYDEIEDAVFNALKKLKVASISQIAFESKTNWATTKKVLERFRKRGVVKLIKEKEKLKVYQLEE